MVQSAGVLILAAGCASTAAPRPAPRSDRAQEIANVLTWAGGPDHRAPRPSSADAYLLTLPVGAPVESATRISPGCAAISSFLPAPAGDDRLFLILGGRLQVQSRRDVQSARVALDGDNIAPLKRLLAFAAAASPLQILASARPRDSADDELWLITVSETSILAARRLEEDPAFRDDQTFFAAFRVPRCQGAGQRCLVAMDDHDRYYLDVEPKHGAPLELFQELGALEVRDATWSNDGKFLYLLAGCRP